MCLKQCSVRKKFNFNNGNLRKALHTPKFLKGDVLQFYSNQKWRFSFPFELTGHGLSRCRANEKVSQGNLAGSNPGHFSELSKEETTSNGIKTSGW